MPTDSSPDVSIVIPVHNDDAWLAETIESVLRQNLPPAQMEIIVVDDGSTDQSRHVAETMLDDADVPSTVLSISNSGPSRARNVGWRQARAPWIRFLDADDLLADGKLALQLRRAGSLSDDAAVLYSGWQELHCTDGAWQPATIRRPYVDSDPVRELLESGNFLQLGCCLFRRRWIERVDGFNEQLWLVEDVHLCLRIAMAGGSFCRVESDNPVFLHRKHRPGSLSGNDSEAHWTACVRNARLAERYWREWGALSPPRRDVLLDIYFAAASTFAEENVEKLKTVWKYIRGLDGRTFPKRPSMLRFLSRLIGYPWAVRLAALYRRIKSQLKWS